MIKPVKSVFFLPILDWIMPIGTDKSPNIINPAKAIKFASKLSSWNFPFAMPTKELTASPKPMQRKAKNIGSVLNFIESFCYKA